MLQTVWFEGLIVEVQFHFAAGARPQRSVRAPTPPPTLLPTPLPLPPAHSEEPQGRLHAAYNISRMQTETLADIKQLFDHPQIHLEKEKPEGVTSELHF